MSILLCVFEARVTVDRSRAVILRSQGSPECCEPGQISFKYACPSAATVKRNANLAYFYQFSYVFWKLISPFTVRAQYFYAGALPAQPARFDLELQEGGGRRKEEGRIGSTFAF